MKVVFVWQMISGYMAACWSKLAAMDDVELHVVARRPEGPPPGVGNGTSLRGAEQLVEFKSDLMHTVGSDLLTKAEISDVDRLAELVIPHKPDVVVLCGWKLPSLEPLTKRPELAGCSFIMGMDTPYRGTMRQKLGGLVKKSYWNRIDHVVVAGERAHRLACSLGFGPERITRGVYGVDFNAFRPALDRRLASGDWPQRFVYVGRYISIKAIDIMCAAYERYRDGCERDGLVSWEFHCCGKGPESARFEGAAGMTDHGFIQPGALADVLAQSGAFVISSRYEPWGTVLAEAAAAGLPIVCTEACGAHLDVVRSYYNGIVAPTDDVDGIARGLRWVHDQRDRLGTIGKRSVALAEPFSADAWADRWAGVCRGLG